MSEERKCGAYRCDVCGGPIGHGNELRHVHLKEIQPKERKIITKEQYDEIEYSRLAWESLDSKEMEVRPAVMRFAQLMEKELQENDYKGAWEDMCDDELVYRLKEETTELEHALHTPCPYCGEHMKKSDQDDILSETADIANFAMMIADNHTIKNKEYRGK
jgi:uncharacterized protein YihD (DUF1040 family)